MIFLIRHGQAGPRHRYDELSELGRKQAAALGRYFASQRAHFSAFYAGSLNRQQQTAAIVGDALNDADLPAPGVLTDDGWNEFSLASVYRALVPHLSREVEGFARDFAEMQSALVEDPHTVRGAAGRCDREVVLAWILRRYPEAEAEAGVESWAEFRARVEAQRSVFERHAADESVAVFTSATPIAITVGAALGLADEKILGLMAALYNASVSQLRRRDDGVWLLTFNNTPHLIDPGMRTLR